MLTMQGVGELIPLSHVYGQAFAYELGYEPVRPDIYSPKPVPAPRKGRQFVPAVYALTVNVKLYTWDQMLDLYLDSEPLLGTPMIHCRMAGQRWHDEDLFGLCQSVKDLPHGLEVGRILLDKAEWLDANPEYRGLPGVAKRHEDKRADRHYVEPPKRPRDWD